MPPRSRLLVASVVFIVAAGAGVWAGSVLLAPTAAERRAELQQRVEATVLPRDYARLPDVAIETAGDSRLRAALAGQWSLLFLGFTNCPDVCPVTLQALAVVTEQLERQDAPRPQVAFVSVDPRRDTPAGTERYARAFDARFLGATGDMAALRELAATLHVDFRVPEAAADASYMVEHPSTVFLLDPQGRIRALFSAPHDPAAIARDLQTIHQTWEQRDEQPPAA